MAKDRLFKLFAYNDTSYTHETYGFENLSQGDLVLFCREDIDGVEVPLYPIALVSQFNNEAGNFFCEYTFPDASYVGFGFATSEFISEQERLNIFFDYQSSFTGAHSFSMSGDAYKIISDLMGYSSSNTGVSSDFLLTSLNGHFGTFKDGKEVRVQGLGERAYFVKSSVVGWDNPTTGGLIINYNLEDAEGKSLVVPFVLVRSV